MLCDVLQPPPSAAASTTSCAARATVVPRDALRRRAYIAPIGLTVSVEGGQIAEIAVELGVDGAGVPPAVFVSLRRHEAAPSAQATLFLRVERIYPPAAHAASWSVSCPEAPACARPWRGDPRAYSHVIRLSAGEDVTQVRAQLQ